MKLNLTSLIHLLRVTKQKVHKALLFKKYLLSIRHGRQILKVKYYIIQIY